jgi:raffinose/stachyose/melibiose transport system permease protein
MPTRGAARPALARFALFATPAVLVYAAFAVYPMFDVFHLSFLKWNGMTPERELVGLRNYAQVFTADPVFWGALRNTLVWTAMSVVAPPLIGLIIAPIAVATIWRWMYDPFFGLVNQTLTSLGLPGLIQDWLGDGQIALYSVFIGYVWQTTGFSMVLFLAGLQGVSPTLVDAARIDGAGRRQVFRFVTLPALRSTITIVVILSLINSLKAFDIVYGMTGGGPAQATQMLAMWAYTQAMQLGDFGRGAAISVVLLLITMAVVIPYLRWTLRREAAAR